MTNGSSKLEGVRVLIVEDEYYLARDCCEWLRDAGAIVAGPVSDIGSAQDILGNETVDAALVDINLGGGPDFALASQLKAQGVPFLFATGYGKDTIPAAFKDAPRLEKPFKPQDLIAAVSALR
jgi:DNA-binding response OmpR family regulator